MKPGSFLTLMGILLTTASACTLGAEETRQPDLVATITAQALALHARAGTPGGPSPTGTSSATLRVTSTSECRAGPSQEFELAFTASPGGNFRLVGKSIATNYWIVEDPAGGTCWLSGVDAVIAGPVESLPELPVPAPVARAIDTLESDASGVDTGQLYRWVTLQPPKLPSPTPPPPTKIAKPPLFGSAQPPKEPVSTSVAPTRSGLPTLMSTLLPPDILGPNPPTGLAFERTCEQLAGESVVFWLLSAHLTWQDSSNETGYRVLLGYYPLASLPQDSTQYTASISHTDAATGPYPPPEFTDFAVEAFNSNGSSPRVEVLVPTCP